MMPTCRSFVAFVLPAIILAAFRQIGFIGEPGARRAVGHQTMFEPALHEPDVGGVGSGGSDHDAKRHDAPEDELGRAHRPHVSTHHENGHGRRHACHHEVHADELRNEALADVLPVSATHHRLHEERLEDEKAKGKTSGVFDYEVEPHRKAERRRDDGRDDDACCVAGHAMNGRADALLPKRLCEALVLAGSGFLVYEYIKQKPDRSRVQRHKYEAPPHNRRFRIVPELVDGHVRRRKGNKKEPDDEEVIDGLDQHNWNSIPVV